MYCNREDAGSSQQQQQQQRQVQAVQAYVDSWLLPLHLILSVMKYRQLSPQDLAFQESLIQERETEIREIETGIHELNEIFRDLGTLVVEQGGMLGAYSAFLRLYSTRFCRTISLMLVAPLRTDNIENNVTAVARDTNGASEELRQASEYQRKAGRRALCLMIVLVIVVCVVLLAVSILFLLILL